MDKLRVAVLRRLSTEFGTPGEAIVYRDEEEVYRCDTLELPWMKNANGISCVIADTYRATRQMSAHFGKMLWRLDDKHGRNAVEWHNGNFAGDRSKGWESQVKGCTLVGRDFAQVERNDGGTPKLQYGITNSKVTLLDFMEATEEADELEITYTWAEGCEPPKD